jgi:hypothetical protein
MSEVIATAEFQGATLEDIRAEAVEAFFLLVGELSHDRYEVVVGTAEVVHILKTTDGGTVVRLWSATCHLVSKETAT